MPGKVFIDTGAFFALKCKSDINHSLAVTIYDSLITDSRFFFTTSNLVLHETVTLVKARLGNPHAIDLGKSLRGSDFIEIIKITDSLEDKGWEIFDKYHDKDFSFIDCTSFAVMNEYVIEKAFTFDRHFKQFGFEILIK